MLPLTNLHWHIIIIFTKLCGVSFKKCSITKSSPWVSNIDTQVVLFYLFDTKINLCDYNIYLKDWNKDGNSNPIYKTAKETLMYRTVFWTLWERERVG